MGSVKRTRNGELAILRLRDKAQSERNLVLRAQVGAEISKRVAAQRGLVPYVRALEAFNVWLKERPKLSRQVEPVMRELGLWEVRLGYDPDRDVNTSIVSQSHPWNSA